MQPQTGEARSQVRPFRGRLLDAILAEIALPGGDQGLDLRGGAALGDRDQRDVIGLAARQLADAGDAVTNLFQSGNGIKRQNLNAVPT